ncbi:MAG: hypothetical protein ACPG19_03970 [Saprospiraceae bacterium]
MREYSIIKPDTWKRNYEIRNDQGWSIGYVNWKGSFTSEAELIGKSNRWDISTNIWWTKLIISDRFGTDVGIMNINSLSSKMTLNYKGEIFNFKNYNWTSSVYIWQDSEDNKLVSFKTGSFGSVKSSGIRVYYEMDSELKELLVLLGWYAFMMKRRQQGAA